jgi:hypothetical protein
VKNKSKLEKLCISIITIFICYHVVSFVVRFCLAVPNDVFWLDGMEYYFGKNLRIGIDKRDDVYPKLALGDVGIETGRLDYNVYAYEGEDGFFFTYKDDVFYSYGSTGFFVIYADPFQIKLLRDENLSGERRKVVDKAVSRYTEEELKLLTSSDELTKEEKEAYERLQLKAQKRIEELKNANEYP